MNQKLRYFLAFLLVIILGSTGWILSTTFRSSLQYYATVSEVKAAESKYAQKIVKVAGRAGHIEKKQENEKTVYHFMVEEGGKTLLISYAGFVPDTFKEGSDVVVTGSLSSDGTFKATEILAKCASKYEAKLNH